MKKNLIATAALMLLCFGTAIAAIPTGKTFLQPASPPMITGTVTSVNDHEIIVDTDQDQRVRLQMDTSTLVPRDLAPGMPVRIDFKLMANGDQYAQRVSPIRHGSETYTTTNPNSFFNGRSSNDYSNEDRYNSYNNGAADRDDAVASSSIAGREDMLPQTASNQPLIALLGLGLLASAGLFAVSRRNRRV